MGRDSDGELDLVMSMNPRFMGLEEVCIDGSGTLQDRREVASSKIAFIID